MTQASLNFSSALARAKSTDGSKAMIQAQTDDDNMPDEFRSAPGRREQLRLPLSADEIAREARSRRRQLEKLRRMIAQREGRDDGR